MHNTSIENLTDYPFDRLRALLNPLDPPEGVTPFVMSLGEPQHPSPAVITETVAAHANEWGKYPPISGTPDLREAIADWLTRRFQLPGGLVDIEAHVLPVAGTKEALYMAGDLCVPPSINNKQSLVLIPNPFYQVYVGAAVMTQAEPYYLSATSENGFLPDFSALDSETLDQTAMAYLCSPSNPQGAIADREYLKNAVRLAREYDFVLIADECYAEIYDAAPPPSVLQACAELGEGFNNVLAVHSLSKRSSAPGLRSGFVAGDPDLISRFKTLRNYGGAQIPMPLQAASAALWRDDGHVEENRRIYARKFDLADQLLSGRLGYYRPEGGFYLWLDVGDGEAAAAKLWTEAGIRVIPGAYLARPDHTGLNPGAGYIRVALVQMPEEIGPALGKLAEIL